MIKTQRTCTFNIIVNDRVYKCVMVEKILWTKTLYRNAYSLMIYNDNSIIRYVQYTKICERLTSHYTYTLSFLVQNDPNTSYKQCQLYSFKYFIFAIKMDFCRDSNAHAACFWRTFLALCWFTMRSIIIQLKSIATFIYFLLSRAIFTKSKSKRNGQKVVHVQEFRYRGFWNLTSKKYLRNTWQMTSFCCTCFITQPLSSSRKYIYSSSILQTIGTTFRFSGSW